MNQNLEQLKDVLNRARQETGFAYEGYLRLTSRLAGLSVLMFMKAPGSAPSSASQLVKNSLGPGVTSLASVPASGSYTYRGRTFRVFTIRAEAFPSGPLTIRVLVPQPYG